jgi:hypothetical protein
VPKQLGFDCAKCGRNYGHIRKKIVKRQKKIPAFRITHGPYEEEIKIPISCNRNIYKYYTLFGDFDQSRKPTMNLPEPTMGEGPHAMVENIERFMRQFAILPEIIPLVLEKYPELKVGYGDFANGIELFLKYIKPLMYNNWDRSWVEWAHISIYAEQHGYNAARRKFPVIKDGKPKYHSAKYIKKKLREVYSFEKEMKMFYPPYFEYYKKLREVIRNDQEIKKKYYELAKESSKIIEQVLSRVSSGNSKLSSYTYYYIRHYDPQVYQKNKNDYENGLIKKKSQVTGKIECGPFREDCIPPSLR